MYEGQNGGNTRFPDLLRRDFDEIQLREIPPTPTKSTFDNEQKAGSKVVSEAESESLMRSTSRSRSPSRERSSERGHKRSESTYSIFPDAPRRKSTASTKTTRTRTTSHAGSERSTRLDVPARNSTKSSRSRANSNASERSLGAEIPVQIEARSSRSRANSNTSERSLVTEIQVQIEGISSRPRGISNSDSTYSTGSNGQDCSDNKHLLASHPAAPAVPQDDLMMQFESFVDSIDQVPNRRITLKTGKVPASQKVKLMQVRKFLRNPWGKKPNLLHEKTKDGGLDGSERRLRQWKSRCFIASVFMGSVLIIHAVFMIWAAQRSSGGANIGTIYQGECATVDNINTGLHVLINITTMIATMASACGMYFLSSQTRKEVDEAHAQGRSLDIGVLSLRNLRTWKKKVLFGVLIIPSLPIYFLGNSIVFTASPMLDYDVVIATPLFLNNTAVDCSQDVSASCTSTDGSPTSCSTQPLNSFSPQYTTNLCDTATSLHHNFTQNQLHHLNTTECLTAYSTLSNPSSNYANLLVITKTQPLTTNNSILLAFHHLQYTSVLTSPHTWTCGPDDPLPGQNTCDIPNLILNADIWTLGPPLLPIFPPSTSTSLQQTPSQRWEIDYCLASPLPSTPLCELQYSRLITLIQIACTGIKFLALLIITFGFGSTTVLANVADAVASFRERSDAVTSHRNFIHRNSAWKSRDGLLILEPEVEGKERKLRWFHGASLPLWVGGLFFSATLLTTTLILLTTSTIPIPSPYTLPPGRTSPLAILKIFSFSSQTFVPSPHTTTAQLFLAAILTNAPQFLVSVAVFLLEQIYTRMQAARIFSLLVEDHDMNAKRKIPAPREMHPFLSLMSLILHIMISQALFVHHVFVIRANDLEGRNRMEYLDVQYTPLGILISLLLGLVMVGWLVGSGGMRLRGKGVVVGSESLEIAGACGGGRRGRRL
ncbi:Acyl- sterol acyltransferase protein [Rutstroemia sp. NJR-2017a WRK4]|nr:Acyl- sterol acyltransferase protein [Rutstroemia sp. NJR-2017a WRK4]